MFPTIDANSDDPEDVAQRNSCFNRLVVHYPFSQSGDPSVLCMLVPSKMFFFIKKMFELRSRYKTNYFRLHLTDEISSKRPKRDLRETWD